ncbi:MAG: XdhC family protein [Dehalococcoidia bacterium]|nr:XdhC family protein [Dehalococcoidia bacterium]
MQNDIYAELVRLTAAGEEAALVTVIAVSGSTPREEGAKMLVRADGSIMGTIGGGAVENAAIKEALEVLKRGVAKKFEYKLNPSGDLGMICGGDTEIFIEPVKSAPPLYIFGGGHIAVPLARMSVMCGFSVTVIDERPGFASAGRFPDAATVALEIPDAYRQMEIGSGAYIVIVTHGHNGDEAALEGALRTPARYIGMIGSKSKNAAVYARLEAKGFSREQLAHVHSPIGLNIKAQTPEEIAVSILAEMIAVRRAAGTAAASHICESAPSVGN